MRATSVHISPNGRTPRMGSLSSSVVCSLGPSTRFHGKPGGQGPGPADLGPKSCSCTKWCWLLSTLSPLQEQLCSLIPDTGEITTDFWRWEADSVLRLQHWSLHQLSRGNFPVSSRNACAFNYSHQQINEALQLNLKQNKDFMQIMYNKFLLLCPIHRIWKTTIYFSYYFWGKKR
jgi:hypothetical protein